MRMRLELRPHHLQRTICIDPRLDPLPQPPTSQVEEEEAAAADEVVEEVAMIMVVVVEAVAVAVVVVLVVDEVLAVLIEVVEDEDVTMIDLIPGLEVPRVWEWTVVDPVDVGEVIVVKGGDFTTIDEVDEILHPQEGLTARLVEEGEVEITCTQGVEDEVEDHIIEVVEEHTIVMKAEEGVMETATEATIAILPLETITVWENRIRAAIAFRMICPSTVLRQEKFQAELTIEAIQMVVMEGALLLILLSPRDMEDDVPMGLFPIIVPVT